MKINKKAAIKYTLVFVIPMIILLIDYYFIGIFPMGDKTLLYRDLKGQYVSYFSDFREAILGNGSLLYSFTKGLGGNMIGILTYYLISPFNILILLFPARWITEVILLITVLKIGVCGITFEYFIRKVFKEEGYKNLLFTTAYALMGFNIVYQSNIMWLDAVYLLPIVGVGIFNLVTKGVKKTYVIALALTILTGFYTGFMVCIFSVIYYGYLLMKEYLKSKDRRFLFKRTKIFIGTSLLAGALSAITLIPTIFALQGGKSTFAFFGSKIKTNFKIGEFFQSMFIRNIDDRNVLSGNLPNIYIGIFLFLLVILYFFNKKILFKEKLLSGGVLVIFFLSMYINKIDFIWHGFNKPIGFPYRYAFIVSFFLLILAYESLIEKEGGIGKKEIIKIGISLGIILIYLGVTKKEFGDVIILNGVFLSSYILLLYLSIKHKEKAILGIGAILFLELGVNGYFTFKNLSYSERKPIKENFSKVKETMKYMQEKEDDFYRIEKDFFYNINDSMMLNYRGIGHFSSMYKVNLRETASKMGFVDSGYWVNFGDGSLLSSNSLLNIKYRASKTKGEIPGYVYEETKNGIHIYKNKYYLKPGFTVNKEILEVEISESDPFKNQELILEKMTGIDSEDCYLPVENYKVNLKNLEKEVLENGEIEYKKVNLEEDAFMEIEFKALSSNPIYMNIKGSSTIKVNESYIKGYSTFNEKTCNLGSFKKGENVKIIIKLNKRNIRVIKEPINYINMEKYLSIYNELKKNELNIEEVSDRKIIGQVNNTKEDVVLYTSIPYEDGFTLKVNGEKKKIEKFNETFIVIPVQPGENKIELEYMPKGVILGIIITSITILGSLVYLKVKSKNEKNSL